MTLKLTTNLFQANTTVEGRKGRECHLDQHLRSASGRRRRVLGSQIIANVTVILSHFLSISGMSSDSLMRGPAAGSG
jgi:hypothetical protein